MAPDPTLAALFERARKAWGDDAVHTSILEVARQTGQLASASSFYRAESALPGRGERSKRQLSLLLALAMATLEKKERVPSRARFYAFAVLSLVFLVLAAILLWKGAAS